MYIQNMFVHVSVLLKIVIVTYPVRNVIPVIKNVTLSPCLTNLLLCSDTGSN